MVRWKPSARSRSLSDISALSAPPARIGGAQATTLASLARARLTGRPSPFGKWRVAPRTPRPSSPPGRSLLSRLPNLPRRDSLCDTYRPWRPVERNESGLGRSLLSRWTERARVAGGERRDRSRLSGLYSSECGAVRLSEREYPAWFERPWLSRHPENLRFSETATASGPRAFNAHERVRCCLRESFLRPRITLQRLIPLHHLLNVSATHV